MSILLIEPRMDIAYFFGSRSQGETISQVNSTIAQSKQLGTEQITPAQAAEMNRGSLKNSS